MSLGFYQSRPPVFTGTDPHKDPSIFLDQMQQDLRVMHVTDIESLEISYYRLQDIDVTWYETWE